AKSRQDGDLESLLFQLRMVYQRIDRIVGGADGSDIHFAQQVANGIFFGLELSGTLLVDLLCRAAAEDLFYIEIPLQFKMRPVIQRVAQRIGYRLGPFLKFLPVGPVARAIALIHAVGSHGAPLVMISV